MATHEQNRAATPASGAGPAGGVLALHQIDESTHKAAIRLQDGLTIETAFHHAEWLCVSSQAGCALQCGFCETGAHGLRRNLTADEILAQWRTACDLARGGDEAAVIDDFATISFSGMGEPLLNLPAVTEAMRHLHARTRSHLHVSTAGVLPRLADLFAIETPFSLDVSLHGATDEVRSRLIPLNMRYPIEPLLETVFTLNARRGALLTICYMLLDGVNDSDEDLARLIMLMRGRGACVELKKYNHVASSRYRASAPERFLLFKTALQAAGVAAYVFGNEGQPINAGCGQLVWSRQS